MRNVRGSEEDANQRSLISGVFFSRVLRTGLRQGAGFLLRHGGSPHRTGPVGQAMLRSEKSKVGISRAARAASISSWM